MIRFKKCFDRDYHDWVFVDSLSSVSISEGYLHCKDCPAVTFTFLRDAMIDGELIENIIADEDEKTLIDIDNQRIKQGLT